MKRPISRKLLHSIARTAEQKCIALEETRKFKPYSDWPPLTGRDYGSYVYAAIVSLFEKDTP